MRWRRKRRNPDGLLLAPKLLPQLRRQAATSSGPLSTCGSAPLPPTGTCCPPIPAPGPSPETMQEMRKLKSSNAAMRKLLQEAKSSLSSGEELAAAREAEQQCSRSEPPERPRWAREIAREAEREAEAH